MSRSDSGVDNRKYFWADCWFGEPWVNPFLSFLRSFEVKFLLFLGHLRSFEVNLIIVLARYVIQDSIRRHLNETGRMQSAVRRLDAGRLDGRRSVPEPSYRIPDLRSGHHRDRDLRTLVDDHNHDNNHDNNNGDNNSRSPPSTPPSAPQPPPPTAQPTHEVRRSPTARWLTMGYKKTLAELMT